MSEHPPSPKKKRRLDEEGKQPSEDLTRCEELWFDDGNIILQAEKTQFRVHRSHISIHSSFFKDMFLVPQPDGEPTIEGCPIIHVYDRQSDWENLLKAMYNVFKTYRMQKNYPIDRILSLLRLGYKYQFDHFRNIAVELLKENFPTTLDEWDNSAVHIEDMNADVHEELYTSGFEIELVNTVMEVGMRSILPVLFFLCIRDCSVHEILEGKKRKDGTVVKLTPDVQKTLISAQPLIIRRAIYQTILTPLAEVEKARNAGEVACKSAHKCRKRSEAADSRMLLLATHSGAALQETQDLCRCDPCNKLLRLYIDLGRLNVWENLPQSFDLPGWGESTDFDG